MVSTRDLLALSKFVLITESLEHWKILEGDLVHLEAIGGETGWTDVNGSWRDLCGIHKSGAVLVRPDGIVAWRAQEYSADLIRSFPGLLKRLLKL